MKSIPNCSTTSSTGGASQIRLGGCSSWRDEDSRAAGLRTSSYAIYLYTWSEGIDLDVCGESLVFVIERLMAL
jgi:hypothetical protein